MDLTEFESGCLREVDGVRWFDLGVNVALATDRFRRAVRIGVGASTTEAGLVAGLVAARRIVRVTGAFIGPIQPSL